MSFADVVGRGCETTKYSATLRLNKVLPRPPLSPRKYRIPLDHTRTALRSRSECNDVGRIFKNGSISDRQVVATRTIAIRQKEQLFSRKSEREEENMDDGES